jgi:hypothetical protein
MPGFILLGTFDSMFCKNFLDRLLYLAGNINPFTGFHSFIPAFFMDSIRRSSQTEKRIDHEHVFSTSFPGRISSRRKLLKEDF